MKTTMHYAIALMMVIGLGRFAMASEATTRPTIRERIKITRDYMGHKGGDGYTNGWMQYNDRIWAVMAATEQSLKLPVAVSCFYWPQGSRSDGKVAALLFWMEDRPSLKELIVSNPETDKEQRIAIPQSRLDEAIKTEMAGVMYGFFTWISPDVIGPDPTQVLEVTVEGQRQRQPPGHCYPSTTMDPKKLEKLKASIAESEKRGAGRQ